MNPKIRSARPLQDFKLDVEFVNGERKIFDVSPYLDSGVFRALRDRSVFGAVQVVEGALEWPGEIDLSWDTIYLRGVTPESSVTLA